MVSFSFILMSLLEYTFVMNTDYRRRKEKLQDNDRKLSVITRRVLQPKIIVYNKDEESPVTEEGAFSARITKKKFADVYKMRAEKEVIEVDNRGRVVTTVFSTEELLTKQNLFNTITKKEDFNNHRTPSRLDTASRIIFPLAFLIFNIWFWAHVCPKQSETLEDHDNH